MLGFCNSFSMIFRGVRHRDGLWRWECSNSRCGGTATSTNRNDLVERNGHYGHLPDVAAVQARKRLSNEISRAEANRDTPVGSLVNQAFGGLNGEFLHAMPARKTVTARLTRHRNKDIGAVNRGERSVNWPVHMKNTNEGEQFLYYDSAANGFRVELLPAGFVGPARRNRNPVSQVKGGMRSKKAIFSREQIQQLVSDYSSGAGLPRMEFLVAIAAHLEKYHGH
uniref:Uncharacterized protein n=1 Tax=Ditylenchus dipsaci TaxID=166011 RepID=A0A915DBP8_9BILA